MIKTGVVILAAGSSKRMGSHKPFLLFSNGKTFVEHLLDVYLEFGCHRCILVTGAGVKNLLDISLKKNENIILQENSFPDRGRFFSIRLGLKHFEGNESIFVQNIDNPFVDIQMLKKLSAALGDKDYRVPVFNDHRGHPVLISSRLRDDILSEKNHGINFREYLKTRDGASVTVADGRIMANINTPEDYMRYFGST